MSVLLDTNVLVRLADQGSLHHAVALQAVERLNAAGEPCVLVPQVLYEYWAVATRPVENNGLGLTTPKTALALERWKGLFPVMRDERGIDGRWETLVQLHDVKGKSVHDCRLVAAMQRHGISDLLTFNTPDFARYTEIRIWSPADVVAGRFPPQPMPAP